jgi:hypothetical protein
MSAAAQRESFDGLCSDWRLNDAEADCPRLQTCSCSVWPPSFSSWLTLIVYGLVAYYSGVVGGWLHRREAVASRLRWVTATSFFGLGVWAALPDRR